MKIEVNKNLVLDIKEEHLIIKNNKLYNNVTKQYEAIDGDIVTFYAATSNGGKSWARGYVEGYTCDKRIKLRGVDKTYTLAEGCLKIIDSISRITDADYDKTAQTNDDWEIILSAQ